MHDIARVIRVAGCLATLCVATVATAAVPALLLAAERVTGEPVTFERTAATIDELMAELPEPSGLKLAAGGNVRWDEVTLRVRGRPAARVLDNLAQLFNYSWERGSRRRTLLQDVRSRNYEEDRRRRWYAAAAHELVAYAALARRPPEYYVRLKESLKGKWPSDRRLTVGLASGLTDPGRHAGIQLLLTLSREQILSLVSAEDGGYYLPWRNMNPRQQGMALRLADTAAMASNARFRSSEEARRWVQEMGLVLIVVPWPDSNRPNAYFVFVGNTLLGLGQGLTPRPTETEWPAEPRGNPYRPQETPSRRAAASAKEYRHLEKMPFPARGFRQIQPSAWPEVLRQLVDRLPFDVYSSCSPSHFVGVNANLYATAREGVENPAVLPLERMSVAEGLDALCRRYGRIWWRDGNTLFFRSRTWFLDRSLQVPRPVREALQQQLQREGRLDREGINLLARLTRRQITGLHRHAQEELKRYVPQSGLENGAYWLLRVYDTLTFDQRARALTAPGLSFEHMTPAQQRAYREALFLSRAPVEQLENPPPFVLEQSIIPGIAGSEAVTG